MSRRQRWLAAGSLGFLLLMGCGSGIKGVPVRGKLTVKGEGPLPQGSVHFVSDRLTSSGDVQPDGTYVLSTFGVDQGVPPGKYKVFVTGSSQGDYRSPKQLIDGRYTTIENTDLEAEVAENTPSKSIDFELDPPKK